MYIHTSDSHNLHSFTYLIYFGPRLFRGILIGLRPMEVRV